MLRTHVEAAGLDWHRYAELGCPLHFAPADAGLTSEVAHVRRSCTAVDAGTGSTQPMTSRTESLAWLDASDRRCDACAGDPAVLHATRRGSVSLAELIAVAHETRAVLADMADATVRAGDEIVWRTWATSLRRAALLLPYDEAFAPAVAALARIEAGLAALGLDQELARWACRYALARAVLVERPGLSQSDAAELGRWASSRPAWFVPAAEFAGRYRQWESHPAYRLTGVTALVGVEAGVQPPGPPRTAPTSEHPLVERFAAHAFDALWALLGPGWTFTVVDTAVAELLAVLAAAAGQRCAWTPARDPFAATVAAAWFDDGVDLDVALAAAAAATAPSS